MKIFENRRATDRSKTRGGVLALGNFDGVHRGHQAVIGAPWRLARQTDRPAGVMTFDPHPRKYFQPNATMFTLTPNRRRK